MGKNKIGINLLAFSATATLLILLGMYSLSRQSEKSSPYSSKYVIYKIDQLKFMGHIRNGSAWYYAGFCEEGNKVKVHDFIFLNVEIIEDVEYPDPIWVETIKNGGGYDGEIHIRSLEDIQ